MSNIITIDGPTSSGKSSVGSLFAKKIGFNFIDTGAIYRAGALLVLKKGVSANDEAVVAEVFQNLKINFVNSNGKNRIFLDSDDITDILHNPEVTVIVPVIAAYPKVREIAKIIQRQTGEKENTVMVGRDIGSEIFPDAKLKFFLTATPEVRAKRRFDQLKKIQPSISFDFVLKQMLYRDEQDSNRAASPLRVPERAIVIDTSNLKLNQTVSLMIKHYKKIFPSQKLPGLLSELVS